MSGFRATVVIDDPAGCPVASASECADEPIDSVTRSRTASDGTVVEEFSVTAGTSVATESDTELTPVQSNDREEVYRFERESAADCACERVERSGTPISSVRAQDGALLLTFRTLELETIATIVDDLREYFDGVVVEELSQDHEGSTADPVVVDRDRLTERQREIVETAHEMGYFAYPKGANATDVAEELGVARSTFTEHLAAAQTKLLDAILEK
ncbi:helix-turn-helix domain-containing protein [Halosolutus amylolyticus]|uniref:Helix-turn-helix domain-containing protein n=1 Tax=Halosolutus amylolyticus TaxID=2932267 RepID=A0ABD5PQL2_9EURY|nr:helix-turn-helix domain-containing protein [Halosolutus amylolyticus]